MHQVGDLFELNVKLRCQKVNYIHFTKGKTLTQDRPFCLQKGLPVANVTVAVQPHSIVTCNKMWSRNPVGGGGGGGGSESESVEWGLG